ncbi:MAG: hypothetical protein K5924_02660 [Chloroflexi bacterium]|nr:hypothetical protein [Chloroflexota bacterium]
MSDRRVALLVAVLLVTAACAPAPTAPSPSFLPTTTAATASPRPTPTPASTPAPTASPTPTSTPVGGLEPMDLRVTGCPGGVVLEWSASVDAEFHHYTALRGPEREIDPAWPPIAPAVDWGDTYVTDRFITSAVDASIVPTETIWNYRVMAYDASNRPVAASPVRHARLDDVVELGVLEITPGPEEGTTHLDWRLFGGLSRCFSSYRVLVGTGGGAPSTVLTAISDQGTTELVTGGLHSGETYSIRVEAARTTTLGGFVVARTETVTYTAP